MALYGGLATPSIVRGTKVHTHTCLKSNPCTGPEVSRKLKFTSFKTIGTWTWYACQHNASAAFNPQEVFLVLIFVRGLVDPRAIVGPEGFSEKFRHHRESNPRPSGLYVARCLNQLRHRVPHTHVKKTQYWRLRDLTEWSLHRTWVDSMFGSTRDQASPRN